MIRESKGIEGKTQEGGERSGAGLGESQMGEKTRIRRGWEHLTGGSGRGRKTRNGESNRSEGERVTGYLGKRAIHRGEGMGLGVLGMGLGAWARGLMHEA